MTSRRAVILHGYTANPTSNWFASVGEALRGRGVAVSIPELPDTASPTPEGWEGAAVDAIAQVGGAGEGLLLVGHSLGAITALRVAAGIPGSLGAVVLVAPFLGHLPPLPELDGYTASGVDLSGLIPRVAHRIAYISDNDPIVPVDIATQAAAEFQAETVLVPNAEHFGDGAGYSSFPQLAARLEAIGW